MNVNSNDKKALEELLSQTKYSTSDYISTTEYRANYDGNKHYDKNSMYSSTF
jgi:hypothetical protein